MKLLTEVDSKKKKAERKTDQSEACFQIDAMDISLWVGAFLYY